MILPPIDPDLYEMRDAMHQHPELVAALIADGEEDTPDKELPFDLAA